MNECQCCGNSYDQSMMADWTICFNCMREEQKKMGYVYTDSLGIGWTERDIQDTGGVSEIEKMCNESKSNK